MLTSKTDKRLHRKLWKLVQASDQVEEIIKLINTTDGYRILQASHPPSGDTIVHVIARHNRHHILKYLHQHHTHLISLESANLDGKEPLHEAASSCSYDVLVYLLTHGSVKVDPLKRAGWTPLMMAATRVDNLEVVKILVQHGAGLHLRNKDGWDAFHIACRTGDVQLVEHLYEGNQQSMRSVSGNGRTPLHTAALHGRTDVIKFIRKIAIIPFSCADNCGSLPVMDAVRSGKVDAIEACLLTSSDAELLRHHNRSGLNCLHMAVEANKPDVVVYLVEEKDFDVNEQVDVESRFQGHSPLHIAHLNDNMECVEILMKLGADPNLLDVNDRYPHQLTMKKCWIP